MEQQQPQSRMKYITYITQSDGAGSQIQRIFNIYLFAKKFNLQYIHSPFHTVEHRFDEKLLSQFNQLVQLPSDSELPENFNIIVVDSITTSKLPIFEKEYPTHVLFKVNVAHEYFNDFPELYDPPFPFLFPWVETKTGAYLKIAVHIRRGDVSRTENSSRFVPFLFYLECMEQLSKMFHMTPHRIYVYSEYTIYPELTQYQERLQKIPHLSYRIDENIIQTFFAMVNSDILVAGHSSLSFSATMLKQKGITIHLPFCATYSKKHIEIHSPQQIAESYTKTKILQAIQKNSVL